MKACGNLTVEHVTGMRRLSLHRISSSERYGTSHVVREFGHLGLCAEYGPAVVAATPATRARHESIVRVAAHPAFSALYRSAAVSRELLSELSSR